MRARLFVHVGPAKTGTSAVQAALRAHDGSDVFYPAAGQWADGAHHNLVFSFLGGSRRSGAVLGDADAMFAAIGREARARGRPIVISSEALPVQRVESFVAALLPHAGLTLADAAVIVVCREHFARAASLYNQNVKDAERRERRDPAAFLHEAATRLCVAPVLSRLAATGIAVHPLNYHPAADFVRRFLAGVGVAEEDALAGAIRNPSLSLRGLVAMLAINRVAADAAERRLLARAMRSLPLRLGPAPAIFNEPAMARAASVFQADRAALETDWGVHLPSPPPPLQFRVAVADRDAIAAACAALGGPGAAILAHAQPYL